MARLKSTYPLLGEEATISSRYGFAIVTNVESDRAAVCVPKTSRKVMSFELVAWFSSELEAVEFVVMLNMRGIGVDDVRRQLADERKAAQAARKAAQQERRAITAAAGPEQGVEATVTRIHGGGDDEEVVDGEVVEDCEP